MQILQKLHECIVTDEEWEAGPEQWETFEDPYPEWSDYMGPVTKKPVPHSMVQAINESVARREVELHVARERSKAKFEEQRLKAQALRASAQVAPAEAIALA